MAEIKKFPKINTIDGYMIINRPLLIPCKDIGESKLKDFKCNTGEDDCDSVVSLKLNSNEIRIMAANLHEAEELQRDFKKINMSRLD
jgi:hypothetical protein